MVPTMETQNYQQVLSAVRMRAELRRLVQAIDRHRDTYQMAAKFANDSTTDGLNWRALQRSSFMLMQSAGDRIMELATEFYQQH